MESKLRKQKAITLATIVFFIVSLIGVGILYKTNTSLKNDLNETKLTSETLLSEKLALQKEIVKYDKEIAVLKSKNVQIDQSLVNVNKILAQKESEIKAAQKDKSKIKTLEKQLAEIIKNKNEIEHQINAQQQNINQLKMIQ